MRDKKEECVDCTHISGASKCVHIGQDLNVCQSDKYDPTTKECKTNLNENCFVANYGTITPDYANLFYYRNIIGMCNDIF